jgi:tetratricopeptide (TPR) repeat protein
MLDKVIEHNLYDILALAQISATLSKCYENPLNIDYIEDKYNIARTLYIYGDIKIAKDIFYDIKDKSTDAKVYLAVILKREGKYEKAIEYFNDLSILSRFDIKYDIEIAKIAEHKLKDLNLALKHTNKALDKINNIRLLKIESQKLDEIYKRKERILKKLGRKTNVDIR